MSDFCTSCCAMGMFILQGISVNYYATSATINKTNEGNAISSARNNFSLIQRAYVLSNLPFSLDILKHFTKLMPPDIIY